MVGAVIVAVSLSVLLAACGESARVSGSGKTVARKSQRATIANYLFRPGALVISAGDTVTWKNLDVDQHTVTADPGSSVMFDSKTLSHGGTFHLTFTRATTIKYHCSYHSFMHGVIKVLPARSKP
jgi:plastocyanin